MNCCVQDFTSFNDYMHQLTRNQYMDALCDFHLLVYLATCDMLPLKVCYYETVIVLCEPQILCLLYMT